MSSGINREAEQYTPPFGLPSRGMVASPAPGKDQVAQVAPLLYALQMYADF